MSLMKVQKERRKTKGNTAGRGVSDEAMDCMVSRLDWCLSIEIVVQGISEKFRT